MAAASSRNELATNTPSQTFGKPAISSNLHWHFRSQVPSLGYLGLPATQQSYRALLRLDSCPIYTQLSSK